jgi:hypothetical protein
MTPEEISAKEHELESRVAALDARETSLDQQLANLTPPTPAATITDPLPPNPNLTDATPPSPTTYATSIKLHVPITLSLNEGNYTSWRELSLITLGRYGFTSHVTGDATQLHPALTRPLPRLGVA